jgi:hypothetical protein
MHSWPGSLLSTLIRPWSLLAQKKARRETGLEFSGPLLWTSISERPWAGALARAEKRPAQFPPAFDGQEFGPLRDLRDRRRCRSRHQLVHIGLDAGDHLPGLTAWQIVGAYDVVQQNLELFLDLIASFGPCSDECPGESGLACRRVFHSAHRWPWGHSGPRGHSLLLWLVAN